MQWIKYCNSFSLLDPWGKMWIIRAFLGVCSMEPARCSSLSERLVSVEDKCLLNCVISDGSATVGTRANNEFMSFITLLQNLKFDQQKFVKSRMR